MLKLFESLRIYALIVVLFVVAAVAVQFTVGLFR
jgi:hypothetical protein